MLAPYSAADSSRRLLPKLLAFLAKVAFFFPAQLNSLGACTTHLVLPRKNRLQLLPFGRTVALGGEGSALSALSW